MCPLRFILVFFSAVLAGYFAWRTARSSSSSSSSSPETDFGTSEISEMENIMSKDKQDVDLKKAIMHSFWVFVDMASGRYLWRNLRYFTKKDGKVRSC